MELAIIPDTTPVGEIASKAVKQLLSGEIDPIAAYRNVAKMKKAIEIFEKDKQARECIMNAFDKYGEKRHDFDDCIMERCETGVKYDFSECGDTEYLDMVEWRKALDEKIKEREKWLKTIPEKTTLLHTETGEVMDVRPPHKTSTTWLKVTFTNGK